LYIADTGNRAIRRIGLDNNVQTLLAIPPAAAGAGNNDNTGAGKGKGGGAPASWYFILLLLLPALRLLRKNTGA
jgi:hypothetical protein